MSNIEEILESLPDEHRKQLLYAYENGFTQVVITNGEFIGVNCANLRNIEIVENIGDWYLGKIKDK